MGIRQSSILILISFLIILLTTNVISAREGDGIVDSGENKTTELTKAAQNPLANLISFPIQNNTNFNYGPLEETQNITNIQPVIPFQLNERWLMISRTIAPLIYQPEFFDGQGSEYGLGDITQSFLFAPQSDSSFLYGAGPVFLLPTATDERLGTDKWGAGPALLGIYMKGPWVAGALVQNIWSFAGDSSRADVNSFLLQYFVNYNFQNGVYLTTSPIITANWEADSDNRWTVPFGLGIGKLFMIGGKLPMNAQIHGYYNVEKPEVLGPDWTLRLQVQFLFPKSLK